MALLPRRREMPAFGLAPLSIQRELNRMQREMDQLFTGALPEETLAVEAWSPNVDVYEDDKGIRLRADVPGIDIKDIDIKVEGDMLTLSGKREESKEEKRENYQRMERTYGEFRRSFTLPDYVNTDKIEASCKSGVLEISIPVKPEAQRKTKHIEVKES